MSPRALALILGVWSIPIALGIAQHVVLTSYGLPQPFSLRATIIALTPFWWFWAAATPLVFAARRRYPLRRGTLLRSGALHAVLAVAISLVHTGVAYAGTVAAGTVPRNEPLLVFLFNILARLSYLDLILYGIVFGAGTAIELRSAYARQQMRAATLEAQLADARLQALRMQLNPHFLFNTLNSVAMLIRGRANPEALRVVVTLSDLLRYVLAADAQEVPLGDEMAFLQEYLDIEKVRFQDRLRVDVTAEPETTFAAVPSLILQPLVENAIRHGISQLPGEGRIAVKARKAGDTLELTIQDNGPGPRDGASKGLGVGLRNTRARLAALYGGGAALTVARELDWTVVRVVLPFRLHETGR